MKTFLEWMEDDLERRAAEFGYTLSKKTVPGGNRSDWEFFTLLDGDGEIMVSGQESDIRAVLDNETVEVRATRAGGFGTRSETKTFDSLEAARLWARELKSGGREYEFKAWIRPGAVGEMEVNI